MISNCSKPDLKDDSDACRAEEGEEEEFVGVCLCSAVADAFVPVLSTQLQLQQDDVKEDCGAEDFPGKQPASKLLFETF